MEEKIEKLLMMPYWIIDILPGQVPRDAPGQYFSIEQYYLTEPRLSEIKGKHIDTVLKLNCYRALSLDEEASVNPPPEEIAGKMRRQYVSILFGDSMIVSEPDSAYMTLYHPDEELLALVKTIAAGEGLFVWQPEDREAQNGAVPGC